MNFFRKVSIFVLLIGITISQPTPPTIGPGSGGGIIFTNAGNIFRVQEESIQENQNLKLEEFFSLLTGPAGALDVTLFDSQNPFNNELILNRLFRLRVRSIVEFEDEGDPGFEFGTDEPVQVYRFRNLTWNPWQGPRRIGSGLYNFQSKSFDDKFGALGVVDLEASDLFVDSSAQELNFAIQNLDVNQLQALNLTTGLAANISEVIASTPVAGTSSATPGTSAGTPGTSAATPGTSSVFPATSAGTPGTSAGTPGTSGPNPSDAGFDTSDFILFTDVGIERQDTTTENNTLIQSVQSFVPDNQVLANPTTFWFQKIDFTSLYRDDHTKIAIQFQVSFSQYLKFKDLVLTLPGEINPRAVLRRFGTLPKFVQTFNGTLIPVIISDFRAVFSPIQGESRFIFFATIDTTDHEEAFYNLTLLRAQGGKYAGSSLETLFANVQANDSNLLNPTSFIDDEAPVQNLAVEGTADPLENFTLPTPLNFVASLDSLQAGLNTTDSEGTGTGTFTLDTNSNQFCTTNLEFVNTNDIVEITLNGPGAPGEQAPTVFEAGTQTSFCFAVTSEQAGQISDGLWYVLVRTASFPEGEIRGQILPQVSEQTQAAPTQQVEFTA